MAVAQAAGRLAAPAPRGWWRGRAGVVAAVVLAMLVAYVVWKNSLTWPASLVWNSLAGYLDRFQAWLSNNRNVAHPNFAFSVFNGFANFLDHLVSWLLSFFNRLTWAGTTALGTLIVLRFGGVRAALVVLAAFASFAAMGLWTESVQTFALMFSAVGLSLFVGIPLGVWAGRSQRFSRVITPILDAAQIVPAFAYLMPVVILFSVGPGAAVVTTMIYAVPPAIRITALGIRGVPPNTVEAATALGSTRWQVLSKVQLPLARRMVLLSVNQTILFALSMVVIAGLIGGQGLGDSVTNGLYTNPALAVLAGAAIVIMAIALDRATEAMAEHSDPARRHLTEGKKLRLRLFTAACAAAVGLAVGLGHAFNAGTDWTARTAQDWLLQHVQRALDYTHVLHRDAVAGNDVRSRPDRVLAQRTAAGDRHVRDARSGRAHRRVDERHGHVVAGARRNGADRDHRVRPRCLGGREQHGGTNPASDQRHPPDAATAGLHHPCRLPDAGLGRSGSDRLGPLRGARRDPPRAARDRERQP
ncbi:MAG: ABC transporter permease subunit [Actinobacteria bacterium]|nr:MAG: ABC transporter permease subunit [Actinomycetota bacterium]